MAPAPVRILVIDDQPLDAELACSVLRCQLAPAQITVVSDALTFAEQLSAGAFDLVICEQRLAWGEGLEILATIKRLYPDCPLVFFSGLSDPAAELEAVRRGADRYVIKGSAGFLQLPLVAGRLLGRQAGVSRELDGAPTLIERLPVGVFSLNAEHRLTCHNQACREVLRLGDKGSAQSPRLDELLGDETARARVADAIDRRLALPELDVRLCGSDGETAWVRISLWPTEDNATGVTCEGIVSDVSVYVQAVSQLSHNAEELGRSNADLERFAYVASHDLQEPLSNISRYARLFSERYRDVLDEAAERYLTHILNSSDRLQRMVEDILAYSRIGTGARSFEPVDFGAMAGAAAAALESAFLDAGASYERTSLPVLEADSRQIQQLFHNLFSNALKFRGGEPLRINVAAEPRDGYWLFSVKDNGIGIDPAGAERIFGVFRRLHTGEEFPGTGIGLAICRSIIERHGGAIWVESEPGQGSTFFFTCSKASATAPVGKGAKT